MKHRKRKMKPCLPSFHPSHTAGRQADCTRPQRAHTEMLDALDTLERLLMKQGSSLCSLEIYLYEEDKAGSLPDGYH